MAYSAARQLKKYSQGDLAGITAKDPAERERLISEYASLVKRIAARLGSRLPSHINQKDLLSAGIMGLLDAIDKFDVEKGTEFKSYAEYRIRGAMLDELRSLDWVPRSVRKNARRLQEAYFKVEKEKMRPAEDHEVARELGLELESFYQLLDEARGVSIISKEEIGSAFAQNDADEFLAGNEVSPLDALKLRELRDMVSKAIQRLPENERMAVTLYYYEELTMKEIGEVLGYTESRISQLHTKAVLRLRSSLRSYFQNG